MSNAKSKVTTSFSGFLSVLIITSDYFPLLNYDVISGKHTAMRRTELDLFLGS